MEPKKNIETVERESLMLVLEEFTQEQDKHSKSINDLVSAVNSLTDKVKDFEGKLDKPKSVTVSTDTRPIQAIVRKGIIDMKLAAASQPKNVIRKFQLLLFPEQDVKLFYKIVFGRWFLWLAVMLFLTNSYKWGIHWNDNQKEIKIQRLENDRLSRAWNYLYDSQGRKIKQVMDSAYIKAGN
ncbi:hypothetical protein [Chitinophaga japonensis]|uniref:Uncharacterized protein n=1 Tax=Chitinophaga japonensis TaxID=104662 RepID=A0A562TBI6_CHIJA|nr:hypothetical protein [Chitinophaga japonensis]TWI90905.1 hypothetical protein LX66_0266 [Chitinophaga japonensis]